MKTNQRSKNYDQVRRTTEKVTKYYDRIVETLDLIHSSLKFENSIQGEHINSALLLNGINLLTVYIGN